VVATTRDVVAARTLSRLVPDGLTIGGDAVQGARFALRRATRPGAISRLDAVSAADASWAVLHYKIATPGLLARARERGLKVMVWTVNDAELDRWLPAGQADIVVTDQPARAVRLRDQ
jgi:glycerophosphoryl diester phosphodiesterase